MNKAHSYLISCDSIGRLGAGMSGAGQNHSEAAGQCPNQRKTIGARPHPSSNAHSIFSQVPAQPDCALLKSP